MLEMKWEWWEMDGEKGRERGEEMKKKRKKKSWDDDDDADDAAVI